MSNFHNQLLPPGVNSYSQQAVPPVVQPYNQQPLPPGVQSYAHHAPIQDFPSSSASYPSHQFGGPINPPFHVNSGNHHFSTPASTTPNFYQHNTAPNYQFATPTSNLLNASHSINVGPAFSVQNLPPNQSSCNGYPDNSHDVQELHYQNRASESSNTGTNDERQVESTSVHEDYELKRMRERHDNMPASVSAYPDSFVKTAESATDIEHAAQDAVLREQVCSFNCLILSMHYLIL